MSSPVTAAHRLLVDTGWTKPGDVSLEDMIFSLNGILKYSPLNGSEGRILINGDRAVITVNSNITYQQRRNWVTAHEIGHFCLHKTITPLFSDTDKTLSEWFKKGNHETEANQFAAELLMPVPLFKQKIKGKRLDIGLLEQTAQYFDVSLTSTFLRYREHGDYPVMIIYIEGGKVIWKQPSRDFPFEYIEKDSKVPVYTVAGDIYYNNTFEEKPSKVDAIEWFPQDFGIKTKAKWQLWEQCFKVSENGIISCLWTF